MSKNIGSGLLQHRGASQTAHMRALIALGGNLSTTAGVVEETVTGAMHALVANGNAICAASRLFRTPCFPKGSGPDYVNAVVEISTPLAPEALLESLHRIEKTFERQRNQRWGARTLDLDLLAYERCVLPDAQTFQTWADLPLERQMAIAPSELILPHPRMHERGFVLIPLCDIRPDWKHPVLGKTARDLRETLPEGQIIGVEPM